MRQESQINNFNMGMEDYVDSPYVVLFGAAGVCLVRFV